MTGFASDSSTRKSAASALPSFAGHSRTSSKRDRERALAREAEVVQRPAHERVVADRAAERGAEARVRAHDPLALAQRGGRVEHARDARRGEHMVDEVGQSPVERPDRPAQRAGERDLGGGELARA
jgi:hypothetical protein